jgi:hypothetical protein
VPGSRQHTRWKTVQEEVPTMLEFLCGLVVFVADIWAILQVAQSGASNGSKALWIALILILPVLGLIIWYFVGPKSRSV